MTVQFPVNEDFSYYQKWRGYEDEETLENAKEDYGQNKYVLLNFNEV